MRAAVLLALTLVAPLAAAVVPAAPFADNAVLQRDRPLPVWGTAAAGETVTVTFAGHSASTAADADGRWRVELPALPASATPAELVIRGGDDAVTYANIVVGDVWLASGQSNMEWSVSSSRDAALEIATSARLPLIRHVSKPSVERRRAWAIAGPGTTGDFSAVAWFFARDLHEVLDVPIGIINCSWGGTPIEAWIAPDAWPAIPELAATVDARWAEVLAAYPEAKARYDAAIAQVDQEEEAAKRMHRPYARRWIDPPPGPGHQTTPSRLFTTLIAPLAPYALRGAIWYQGESNGSRPEEYHALLTALITGWRRHLAQGELPFYWAQLANFNGRKGTAWAYLREAQSRALALPATGQAVTIDVGEVADIHPRDKRPVGRRLARIALARSYGLAVVDRGPTFVRAERFNAGFRVHFAETHGGLRSPHAPLRGFEVAGEDRVFRPARATIDGTTVLVDSPEVAAAVAVRYAWYDAPDADLVNGEGLPAVPFRSDDWPRQP